MKKKLFTRLLCFLLIFSLSIPALTYITQEEVKGADNMAVLRIISTTDMHAQGNFMNYDTGSEHYSGSLSQVYTLIREAREDIKGGTEATLTVDCGDTIYGFASDQIYNGVVDGTEYMYEGMAEMEYDAMTLGNHDFDYGLDYIKDTLEENDLSDKVVLSNIYDAKTKRNVWSQYKIITKTLTTKKGEKKKVKIGIIGVLVPYVSNNYDYTGILQSKAIVDSVESNVGTLEELGTDVIVVLAHCGVGPETTGDSTTNCVYEITQLQGVDAVVCGHNHKNWPSDDRDVQNYFNYDNVEANGCMNDVPVTQLANLAAGIGIIDLEISFEGKKPVVMSGESSIRYVDRSVKMNRKIYDIIAKYDDQMDELLSEPVVSVDEAINGYFGTFEDNAAMQAANEAKIQYGLEYIKNYCPDYKDCIVVASTGYNLVGVESQDDFLYIDEDFTLRDALNVQRYGRKRSVIYWITGAKLREQLEYRVGRYYNNVADPDKDWEDENVAKYVKAKNLIPLLSSEKIDDWSDFAVFDGIEYTIDLTSPARYDDDGRIIDPTAHRISSLTCNGVKINDGQKLILVSDALDDHEPAGALKESHKLGRNGQYNTLLLVDYLKRTAADGVFSVKQDDNWRISVPESDSYLVKASETSDEMVEDFDWYVDMLGDKGKYAYYKARFGSKAGDDKTGPLLVVGQLNREITNHDIRLVVQSSDPSGVAEIKYAPGTLGAYDEVWAGAVNITASKSFTITENGDYTARSVDKLGNATVKYFKVDNYSRTQATAPVLKNFTNKKTVITGTCDPNAAVYVSIGDNTYGVRATPEGTFSLDVGYQRAGRKIEAWIETLDGLKSAVTESEVLRKSANYPTVNDIDNTEEFICGYFSDDKYSKIIAVANNGMVYVPKGCGYYYRNSDLYKKNATVKEVEYNVYDDGYFELETDCLNSGTTVKVYAIDWIYRYNKVQKFESVDVAPNRPRIVHDVLDADNRVYVRLNEPIDDTDYTVTVKYMGQEYSQTVNSSDTTNLVFDIPGLEAGKNISVKASDTVRDIARNSATYTTVVDSYEDMLVNDPGIEIVALNDEALEVEGFVYDMEKGQELAVMVGDDWSIVDVEDNSFSISLDDFPKAGTKIVAVLRDKNGYVEDVATTTVRESRPEKPKFITEKITDETKTVKIFCYDKATVNVKIGNKIFKTSKCKKGRGGYVYTVKIDKPKAGKTVKVYMSNSAGNSKVIKRIVKKTKKKAEETEEENQTED
ncbi:MAG: metallophosphoesterase [Lachnospiraceae bacterium]|nr:metallophosphoesterase [Lachnospiraceae bacterium]